MPALLLNVELLRHWWGMSIPNMHKWLYTILRIKWIDKKRSSIFFVQRNEGQAVDFQISIG